MPQPPSQPAPGRSLPGKTMGTLHPDAPAILIPESVLERILDYSEQDMNRELGGFLLGGLIDGPRPYLHIRHFLPATEARSQAASLTFTHETWSALHREVEQRYPHEQVVGWYHTHPGLGVFLSGYDLFIHQNFFRESWQIALVVDPQGQEFSFFQWRGPDVVDCGFVCLSEES